MTSKKYGFVIFVMAILCTIQVCGQVKKRLYIANDDHTDYMWAGNVAQYDSAFVKMLDYQLLGIAATKNNPSDYQTRFNCDGSYWIKTYAKYRSTVKFNKLIEAIRSGHISSQLNELVSTYGAQPTEAVIRGMYYAGHLERKYNLHFTMASAMENNTIPLGLSSLWAGAGAKYSWKGIGGYGSQLSYASRAKRKYQLYRYTGLDSSSVLMKWYAYNEKTTGPFGSYAECRLDMKSTDTTRELGRVIDRLDKFCDTISLTSKYPYNICGAFGYGHDNLETFITTPYVNAARLGSNDKRSVRVSNEEDFFKDVEKTYPHLPTETVSFGNEWDLLCASMNETTAEVRRATEKLRSAEAMAALVSIKEPAFADKLISARDDAWDAFGLYWEHNWTADGPVGNKNRGAWQVKIKDQLCTYVDSLYTLSQQTLAAQLKATVNTRFYVFNPMSWTRDDIADVAYTSAYPVKVIDVVTKKQVASQLIVKNGKQFLRIEANQIPPVGYKVFEIEKGAPTPRPLAAKVSDGYISNANYRIKLTPSGVISQIIDKQAGNKQLIKNIDGRYLNDLGTNNINDGNPLVIENAGPVSVTLKAVSKNPVLHTVRLTLFAHSRRIDIENSIDTNFRDNKWWAFSLNLLNPITHHEELGAILIDKKQSRGGNYSDENARYDWQTFNHFADLSNRNFGITISNLDCSFFKLGKSTVDSLCDQSSQLNALAGGQIDTKVEDKGALGINDQFGQNHFHYHFALMPHAEPFNAITAMKFALEHQNPLVCGIITGNINANPDASFSLLSVNNPDVLLWSVKPSEEGIGNGLITRMWNLNGKPVNTTIKLYTPISLCLANIAYRN